MSNTYRRKNVQPHSEWEIIYATIAKRLMSRYRIRIDNAFSTAKFLGAFVWLFTRPYSWYKRRKMKKAVAKIISTRKP